MFNEQDKALFNKKGMSVDQVKSQLKLFRSSFPYLKIAQTAAIGNGITNPDKDKCEEYAKEWNGFCHDHHTIVKFVPASGAASRMFKDLYAFIDAPYNTPQTIFENQFFDNIYKFAFFDALDSVCIENNGSGVKELIEKGSHKAVVKNLLESEGLNYGSLPKGLLLFHTYKNSKRTPFEEHLVEAALYATGADGYSRLCFTISQEHREQFTELAMQVQEDLSKRYGVVYHISFSEQKSYTDTIAVGLDNQPFRNEDGNIVFRPGGHGALIENLNSIDADIIFIKNIDNVVPDRLKNDTVYYKKVLAGALVTLRNKVYEYLRLIDTGHYRQEQLIDIVRFLHQDLNCRRPDLKEMEDGDLVLYLREKLNRPIRVCGMVKNSGEPGGGPFLAYNNDGTVSPQILESSQIDFSNPEAKAMFTDGTHFNPVDLVCSTRDYKGKKFNLANFVDPSTGFISIKSKDARELKALELPGLWNGAMSGWNTLFIEVPPLTFNPVKTVNDLLRPEHSEF